MNQVDDGDSGASLGSDAHSEVLIRAAREGEAHALDELIDTWRAYLLHVANDGLEYDLNPKLGASDIVQSACVDIYRQFENFQGETAAQWKAWLRQLVLRDLQDVRRRYRDAERRSVKRERPIDDLGHKFSNEDDSPQSSLIAEEEAKTLRLALQGLSEEHRLVLKMRNWDELSFAEIGTRMNRSEEAARKLWNRAVQKLEQALERITSQS